MRPGKIETFAHYSPFESLQDFNDQIAAFLAVHRNDFSPGELIAFKRLVRFCAKYPGVANAKITTVVAACTEAGGVSRSTFERMLRKAKKLEILKVHHTVRQKGGFAHNVFVFQRFDRAKEEKLTVREKDESACEDRENTVESAGETGCSLETKPVQVQKNRMNLNYTYTGDHVPQPFRDLVKCFFDSAETIERYASRLRMAAFKTYFHEEPDTVIEVGIQSFKQLIGKMKKGIVRDSYAYFYRICENKFDECLAEEMRNTFDHALETGSIPEGHWLLWKNTNEGEL